MTRSDREFDLILWGATGFTGQLVAEYLWTHHRLDSLRWAIGARNESKLSAMRERLGAPDLPIVTGDADDDASMASLAARAGVVCSTVGPYARHGSPLVAACVTAGTQYCDLSAELPWIRRMIDAHHLQAEASGARIVHACGFDSIPSDLGVFFLQREMRARYGAPSSHVKCGVAAFRGGVSGGTAASMLNLMKDAAEDSAVRRILADPYGINPEGQRGGPDGPNRRSPAYDADFDRWTAPFVMAAVNTRVVRRSAALLPDLYGPGFRYEESTLTGKGFAGAARATAVAAGMAATIGGMAFGPVRRMLASRLPRPGEGPTPEQQENGFWSMRLHAAPPDVPGAVPLRARLDGDRDPGYGSTAKMIAESAVCLALDPLDSKGGFHTPASAMGDSLIDRLQERAGVTFEVD